MSSSADHIVDFLNVRICFFRHTFIAIEFSKTQGRIRLKRQTFYGKVCGERVNFLNMLIRFLIRTIIVIEYSQNQMGIQLDTQTIARKRQSIYGPCSVITIFVLNIFTDFANSCENLTVKTWGCCDILPILIIYSG